PMLRRSRSQAPAAGEAGPQTDYRWKRNEGKWDTPANNPRFHGRMTASPGPRGKTRPTGPLRTRYRLRHRGRQLDSVRSRPARGFEPLVTRMPEGPDHNPGDLGACYPGRRFGARRF